MRLSVNRDSPYFDREKALLTCVFCDGVHLWACVEFDSDEGWADCVATDDVGHVVIDPRYGDRAAITRYTGKITYRTAGHQEHADKV